MPDVVTVDAIAGECGADGSALNDQVAYCTTRNVIFISEDARRDLPQAAYLWWPIL
jgi:hypothetical protein